MNKNRNYKYREIAGQYYLIPIGCATKKSTSPIQLTETAAWIWQQIEEDSSSEVLAQKMTQVYDIDLARAQKAVTGFLDELHSEKLLEI